MTMRLAPLFNDVGLLLGHIDLDCCLKGHDWYRVDEGAGRIGQYTTRKPESDTVRVFRIPIRKMWFRWGNDEQTKRYLVVDGPVPEWVWSFAGIKFNGAGDWERL